jgi:hypothetical protein
MDLLTSRQDDETVVVRGRESEAQMNIGAVPAALRERLGAEGTGGLVQLLDQVHREGRADVIAACTERFERRLVEEVAGLRVQVAKVESSLRQDMSATGASLRQDMSSMGASLRQEISEMSANLRQEISSTALGLHKEMAAGRVEILRWCFLFWISQVAAMAGILGVMLRVLRP